MVKPKQSRKKPCTKKYRNRKQSGKHARRQSRRRSRRQSRGGVLEGAPVNYSLSGDWSSQRSLGQGSDFFKYHEDQHGGQAPYPSSVDASVLPGALRGPAGLNGLDMAFSDIKGMRDPPYDGPMMGGKRRKRRKHGKHCKTHKKSKHSKHSKHSKCNKKSSKRRRHSRGGSLGYAPFPSQGMLLDSEKAYADAALRPEWKTGVEIMDARIRNTQ